MAARFGDRRDAGRRLGAVLAERAVRADVVLALPRGGVPVAFEVAELADDVVAVLAPQRFGAVGTWYARFDQTSDAEVVELLEQAADRSG